MQKLYSSTRGGEKGLTSAEVIKKGLASDGGLFMPDSLPKITLSDIDKLSKMTYPERAATVLSLFLTDYDFETLLCLTEKAYAEEKFGTYAAPVEKIGGGLSVLELWHGPTCAFKDMALQIMPHLLSQALKMTKEKKEACILVATSGDTGKAALEGYRDVDGIKIMVFYPSDGVSNMQKLQMSTQEGSNVNVCAIEGNFDDAQSGVKKIFGDKDFASKLHSKGIFLSSANSINWGRLAPQIVYYISAYADMVSAGSINLGDEINVTVPTGNFGNIFAAYLAKLMGLPISKLICASNMNNVLTDFLKTGTYNKNRPFHTTMSPSMDILISSNLERLLYLMAGAEETQGYMSALNETGEYTVSKDVLAKIKEVFHGEYCDEENTAKTIRTFYEGFDYLCDTHTACALFGAREYIRKTGDRRQMLVVSTASPYKFPVSVYKSLGEEAEGDDYDVAALLSEKTGTLVPSPIAEIHKKEIRFKKVIAKEEMQKEVLDFVK